MKNAVRIPGLVLTDHEFEIPLDYADPDGEAITIFARELVAANKEGADLPWLLFLTGGPGVQSPRIERPSGWLKRALKEYRVLLLDQRGTGRSTPVNHQTMARFLMAEEQADYLKQFRADAIVRDAEMIRRTLVGNESWSVLGQSYGGFCIATYLSLAPEGLREAIFTGGLPPIGHSVDEVYRATYRRVIEQNRRYYNRYPGDRKRVREIVDYLRAHGVTMPGGGILSPQRLQGLGLEFGYRSGFEAVHYLVEAAFVQGGSGRELSYSFLRGVQNHEYFETNPIYAILQESIYCEGVASNWSAERVRAEYPEFAIELDQPFHFTGEMVYPWMFDEYERLRPLKEAAGILACYDNWPRLYNREQLAANEVPTAAVVYYDDMYVERRFSEETAHSIKGMRIWLTNELDHNGLWVEGERVLGRLLEMLKGEA